MMRREKKGLAARLGRSPSHIMYFVCQVHEVWLPGMYASHVTFMIQDIAIQVGQLTQPTNKTAAFQSSSGICFSGSWYFLLVFLLIFLNIPGGNLM